MAETKKILVEAIPGKFKEIYKNVAEIKIDKIDQQSVDKAKKALYLFLTLNKPDEIKLVGIKMMFLTKDGVLCETGNMSSGFEEENWRE